MSIIHSIMTHLGFPPFSPPPVSRNPNHRPGSPKPNTATKPDYKHTRTSPKAYRASDAMKDIEATTEKDTK